MGLEKGKCRQLPLIGIIDKNWFLIICGGRGFGRGTANDTTQIGVSRFQEEEYLDLYI